MYSNNKKSDKKKPEEKKCICPNCEGVPVINGMCLFHFSCEGDEYLKGAMSIVLRNHPNYHKLLNYARLCNIYDPPHTKEEWQVVHSCAQLLDRVNKLPEGFDLDNKDLFKNLMLGYEKMMTDSIRFSPTLIAMELEQWILDHVMNEARKVMAASQNRESLLSSADREEVERKRKYRKEDFVAFGDLPMFKQNQA